MLTGDHEGSREQEELQAERDHLLELWATHPWAWLTGKDVDGTAIVLTVDEMDRANPVKPFPEDFDYLHWMLDRIHERDEKGHWVNPMIFMDKPRQIMATWTVLAYADWDCRFSLRRNWLLSKMTQDEGEVLLADKVVAINDHLPAWVRDAVPLDHSNKSHFHYPKTASQFRPVASNAHRRAFRGSTPSDVIIDELAYQDNVSDMVAAALPAGCRIIGMSTANATGPGSRFAKKDILGLKVV